jgi:hypothetical protein
MSGYPRYGALISSEGLFLNLDLVCRVIQVQWPVPLPVLRQNVFDRQPIGEGQRLALAGFEGAVEGG